MSRPQPRKRTGAGERVPPNGTQQKLAAFLNVRLHSRHHVLRIESEVLCKRAIGR